MRSKDYGPDVLAGGRLRRGVPREVPRVVATIDLVIEERASGWCGAVIAADRQAVTLEDRTGRRRAFPYEPAAFLLDGLPVTLTRPPAPAPVRPVRTASGSTAVHDLAPRVARESRIYVEGVHDAALVERVWGDDLRIEGVAVEFLEGVDGLPEIVARFRPGPGRRLGVLVDHLVPGSKESRIAAGTRSPHVLVTGHPYVDVWQAVKPAAVGIASWPVVPPGQPWKDGICAALGVPDPREMWRRILAGVRSYADLEVPLLRAMEELIDFVTG